MLLSAYDSCLILGFGERVCGSYQNDRSESFKSTSIYDRLKERNTFDY